MNNPGNISPQVELQLTGDGSHTLFVPSLNEHYHSVFGAVTESVHIFMGAGFNRAIESKERLDILEIGFGSGLNVLLTFLYAQDKNIYVNYRSLEKNPLPFEMTSQINFPARMTSQINFDDKMTSQQIISLFSRIHSCDWNEDVQITNHCILHKILSSLEDYQPEKSRFDLVYFDAFGPDVQPELWTHEIFNRMGQGVKPGGLLVTYSTKGEVKRNLRDAGFTIEKLPGPPGKREILRATKV